MILELRGIQKDYPAGGGKVEALRGIDLSFREAEFVSILGPSGCGKTTLLNLIGGLDSYTEGDLLIGGVSTKQYKDRDWDAYRNHSIGFVFQNYHLIPHQTVLSNVELALTLSGVSKKERRQRAKEALEAVGLGDQLKKRPGEMSGGQMQRVAIARALVNNPQIILADEPTGALDTATSLSVMEILKEISKERLVIMVTHNPELAEQYSSRIIRMLDGKIIGDSAPLTKEEQVPNTALAEKRRLPSMKFSTSFGLSLQNLFTKKGRTLLTAFAGSIGIIGIALILALSTGINGYIEQVQRETLSSYPITIEAETMDMTAMMAGMMEDKTTSLETRDEDKIYSSTVMYDMMNSMFNMETTQNDLASFKAYLESEKGKDFSFATVQYRYDVPLGIYTKDTEGAVVKSDIASLIESAMSAMTGGTMAGMNQTSYMQTMTKSMSVWQELLAGEDGKGVHEAVQEQYDILYGTWPQNYDEAVLFVNKNNEISDLHLVSLGLVPSSKLDDTMVAIQKGETLEGVEGEWSYEELCALPFKLILPVDYYRLDEETNTYTDLTATEAGLNLLYATESVGTPIHIVGIMRPKEDTMAVATGTVGYTHALSLYAMEKTMSSPVVQAQLKDPTTDVLSGLPFPKPSAEEPTVEEMLPAVKEALSALSQEDKATILVALLSQMSDEDVTAQASAQVSSLSRPEMENMILSSTAQAMGVSEETVKQYISGMTDEELRLQMQKGAEDQIRAQYASAVAGQFTALPTAQKAGMLDALLQGNEAMLTPMGLAPLKDWQVEYLFKNHLPATQSQNTYDGVLTTLGYVDEEKPSAISLYATTFEDKDRLADLIADYNASVAEEQKLEYTDYVALLMSSVTAIISGISYLLIAFVSISLVVSSIMTGVITLISVQERTKEIGILRAIGASKKNVASLFNAETLIIGISAGLVGIGSSYLLTLPINAILLHFTGIPGLKAVLPVSGAVVLVIISAVLTLLAGIIPSRSAAKKDPVVALRTE